MFMNNTYRWDYDKVAALVAPRALCIVNTDKDTIFPIDGVFKIYNSTRRIYKLLGAEKNIGLQIAEGPHADTQPLNTGEFHWMTRFLQGADAMSTLDAPAVHSIPMEKLRVFNELPKDERNTKLDESFVPMAAESKVPESGEEWGKQRDGWMGALREKALAGIEEQSRRRHELPIQASIPQVSLDLEGAGLQMLLGFTLESEVRDEFTDAFWFLRPSSVKFEDLELVVLNVLDEQGWQEFANTYAHEFPDFFPQGLKATPDKKAFEQEKKMFENFKWGMAYVCPRGIGPTAWDRSADTLVRHEKQGGEAAKMNEADRLRSREANVRVPLAEKTRVQSLRRFYLLGQTLEGQQVWDVRCAIRALRSIEGLKDTKLWLQASRTQAANALMASLFEENIARLDLHELPHSLMPTSMDKEGHPISGFEPVYLNMLKYLDLPQAAAMAAERTRVVIYDDDKTAWNYPAQVSEKLGWGKEKKNGLQLRDVPKAEPEK